MKRLLLVCYHFPPFAGPGVFRPLRLCKYLPGHGWEVTVVTVGSRARLLKDPSLERDVPASVRVERTVSLEPRLALLALRRLGLRRLSERIEPWFRLPDDQRGWVPFAVRRAGRVLRRERHAALLTTSAPYSAHLVGLRLRERFGLPWVADFRDEWTTNPYIAYPSAWHRRLNEGLERRVLLGADRVVCVSEPWLDNLARRVPEAPADKFQVLPNGYDAEHFRDPGPRPDRFRIVYTGEFYGPRSPIVFVEALGRAVASGRIPREDLEVVFVGHRGGPAGPAGLEGCDVRVIGQRPYAEALEHLRRAALLLLVIPAADGPGKHTGKLFHYLAAGRPILALAPHPNVAADLVERTRSGRVAPPDDSQAVERVLVEMYADWKSGRALPAQDRETIASYEARPQTAAWARLLDGIVAGAG